jgi:predicted dithiol-disulfide oxidoreductase (DUF899 family)
MAEAYSMRTMPSVSSEDWRAALAELRTGEKALTRAHDELAAKRRRMPGVPVTKPYRFAGPDGTVGLTDLFAGRHQLIVYHHMLKPADSAPCSGCCMVGDQIPHFAHLHARDTSLVFVSHAPADEIEVLKKRLGWSLPWYATFDDFNADNDVTDGFGLNVFFRDGTGIYRTYFTTGRGVETLGTVWTLLDLTPLGRQEGWEESPPGTPQSAPYEWWRLHDEYPGRSRTGDPASEDSREDLG